MEPLDRIDPDEPIPYLPVDACGPTAEDLDKWRDNPPYELPRLFVRCPYPCQPTHRDPVAVTSPYPNYWAIVFLNDMDEHGCVQDYRIIESLVFDDMHPLFCKTEDQRLEAEKRRKEWFSRVLQAKLESILIEAAKCGGRWWR